MYAIPAVTPPADAWPLNTFETIVRDLKLDQPVIDPTTLSSEDLTKEIQRVTKALLGYGVAHFIVYAGAVVAVAHLGIAAVAIAGSVVHAIFLAVAYLVLLRGEVSNPLRVLWQDVAPASTACLALFALAVPVDRALAGIGSPTMVHMAGVGLAGGIGYLLALRLLFPASSHDLGAAVRRILPDRLSFGRGGSGAAGEEAALAKS